MKVTKIFAVLAVCLILVITAAGCIASTETPSTADTVTGEVNVFAAASLTGAFNEIKAQFETENPGITLSCNYAGSQALKTQILEGADCDVYVSANDKQFDPVVEAGIIKEKNVLLQNKLGILVAKDNPKKVASLADLPNVRLVIGNDQVPFGQYTRDIIKKYEDDGNAGYVDSFMKAVETEVDAVTNVKSYITLGEADSSIVYISDISKDDKKEVSIIEIPDKYNVIADYPYGITNAGLENKAVLKFVEFLTGPKASAILVDYGLSPVTA